jgi:tetratricopeptide (TPR) repeat protein
MPESLAEIERARELDPTSRSIAADEAYIEYNAGNVEDGISKLRILEQSESDLISVHRFLATALYETKDFPGFLKESEHVAAISNNAEEKSVALAARKGWLADGEHSMLTAMLDARRKAFDEKRNTGFDAALLAAKLGKRDEAIRYLQTAFEARDYMVMTIADGRLDSLLKGDPAFEAFKSSVRSRMMNVEPNGTKPID